MAAPLPLVGTDAHSAVMHIALCEDPHLIELECEILSNATGLAVRLSPREGDAASPDHLHHDYVAAAARAIGISLDEHRRLARLCTDWVKAAARAMLRTPFGHTLGRLPFASDDRIVLVGDSLTADRCSWGELLAECLAVKFPGLAVVNLAVSGSTSTQAIAAIDRVRRARPTWVLEVLGTNDARRHGTRRHRSVSAGESARNRRVLADEYASMSARLVAFAPPGIDSDAVDRWPFFVDQSIGWNAEDLAPTGSLPEVVSLAALVSRSEVSWRSYLMSDGVHPTPSGHAVLLEAVVDHLAASTA